MSVRSLVAMLLAAIATSACDRAQAQCVDQRAQPKSVIVVAPRLSDARRDFSTRLVRREAADEAVPRPPSDQLQVVSYPTPIGPMAAYVTPDPNDGERHPAIIWIVGGFGNSIGDVAWNPAPAANDQSASSFRAQGIVTMYPSVRGGNKNPGFQEVALGEVDDVIRAADYLAKLPYVDPKRIYLGGHSTGGTLAVLVAESTACFRAAFAFGPAADIRGYGDQLPFDITDAKEVALRSPVRWLQDVRRPLYIFEGSKGNVRDLRLLERANRNAAVHVVEIGDADHFSVLLPLSRLIAKHIRADRGTAAEFVLPTEELTAPVFRRPGAP